MKPRACLALPLVAFCFFATALHAATTPPCTLTLSYSPKNPIVYQPISLSASVETSVPLTGNNILYGQVLVEAYPVPPLTGRSESVLNLITGPTVSTLATSLTSPGQWNFTSTFTPLYSFGSTGVCGSGSLTTSLVITVAPANDASQLTGQYAFLLDGIAPNATTPSGHVTIIGSFTADGHGHITAGVEDANSASTGAHSVPLTGTYTLDSLGHGTLTLSSTLGSQHASFFVPQSQLFGSPVQHASLISTDKATLLGNGYLSSQTSTYMPQPSGYTFSQAGDSACISPCAGSFLVFATGLLTFTPEGTATADYLASSSTTLVPEQSATGAVGQPDVTTGRFTYTLTTTTPVAGEPTHFVGYILDNYHIYTMSLDPHTTYHLLSGTAYIQ